MEGLESSEEKIARLEKENAELRRENAELREKVYIDELTHLKNRHALEEDFKLIFRPKRESGPDRRNEGNEENVCAMMVDIDHFKNVNDTYGHDAGDKLLVEIGKRLGSSVRGKDIVARYGGEEFVVFLVEASESKAEEKAEEMRKIIADEQFNIGTTENSQTISMTASIGVTFGDKNSNPGALIKEADTAMYQSKSSGRNKVTVFSKLSESQ